MSEDLTRYNWDIEFVPDDSSIVWPHLVTLKMSGTRSEANAAVEAAGKSINFELLKIVFNRQGKAK